MRKFLLAALPLFATVAAGSIAHAALPANAKLVAAAPQTRVEFEVFLPLRNEAKLDELLTAQQTVGSPKFHQWLTPAQFAAQFGPTQSTMDNATAALTRVGLQVTPHTRSLHVSGTAAQVNAAFQTTLNEVSDAKGRKTLVSSGPLKGPDALQQEGVVIPAFSPIPLRQTNAMKLAAVPDNRLSDHGPYYFDDLKQAYDYPSYESKLPNGQRLDGSGVSVAVLMETDASDSDLQGIFDHEQFTTVSGNPAPTMDHLKVDGGAPFDPNSNGSFEANLDVQQVLGGAPGAHVTLVSIPTLADSYILDGYVTIVDQNKWDIVNSSFGGCELNYTKEYNDGTSYVGILTTFHQVFKQGNAEGITFVASSGDSGGLSCTNVAYFRGKQDKARFVKSVQNPADDPAVTGVGGGNLVTTPPASGSLTSKYVSENTFGDPEVPYDPYGIGVTASGGYWGAGGGRSVIFPQPGYQNGVSFGGTMRAIPDVGMQVGGCPGLASSCNADDSAAVVEFGGVRYGVIGTSVSSPEFVGAMALYEQMQGGRMGNFNHFLYNKGVVQDSFGGAKANKMVQFYHKNIRGFDGAYGHASDTYDYLIGNGTPDVRVLFGMTAFPKAGDPQTPSNP